MSRSRARVQADAQRLNLTITIVELAVGTRSAADAAAACDCRVDQIIKSVVFRAIDGDEHFLFLTAGNNQVALTKATDLVGIQIEKADADSIRRTTGFAIGGVSPLGHLRPIRTWLDPHILDFTTVWAAAGTPNHVFAINPRQLAAAIAAKVADFTV